MSATRITFNLNHKSVKLWTYDNYGNRAYGGYVHKWSDWIKFSSLAPNTNLTNICADGTYNAVEGESYPVYVYFIRHHLFSAILPYSGGSDGRIQIFYNWSYPQSANEWVYDESTNIANNINSACFEYVSGTSFEQQCQYWEEITGIDLGSGDQSNQAFINKADFSDKAIMNRRSRYTWLNNKFDGTEEYKNDLPNYNPLKIKSCETVFDRNKRYKPQSTEKMVYAWQNTVPNDLYILGCFGGATTGDMNTKKIKPSTNEAVIQEINKDYVTTGIFSYFTDSNDVIANVSVPTPPINNYYIANFTIGDRIQYISDYGFTEILVGAELK